MNADTSTLPLWESASPPNYLIMLASADFAQRAARTISRHFEGNLLAGLVLLALLQRRFSLATFGPAEREAAQAVSAKSLARSLNAAPETMRRCVVRLIENGWCTRLGRLGIVPSQSAAGEEQIATFLADIRADFLMFLSCLKSVGFDFDLMGRATLHREANAQAAPPDIASLPGIDAAIVNFGLRIVEIGAAPFDNDYSLAWVFGAIMMANAAPFAYDATKAWLYSTYETQPSDEACRPTNLAEVSQNLGIPYETARRHVNRLISLGVCLRNDRKGLLVPTEIFRMASSVSVTMDLTKRFSQMVSELKRLGFDFSSVQPLGGQS